MGLRLGDALLLTELVHGEGGGGGGDVIARHGHLHVATALGLRAASVPYHSEVAPDYLIAPLGPSTRYGGP